MLQVLLERIWDRVWNGDGPIIDARDGVVWRGGEVDAGSEGDDGEQPLQASHEPTGLL